MRDYYQDVSDHSRHSGRSKVSRSLSPVSALDDQEVHRPRSSRLLQENPLLSPFFSTRPFQTTTSTEYPPEKSEEHHTKEIMVRHRRLFHFGWWWELGSACVAIISTALIVAILVDMDGKPLANWRFHTNLIQPNSLVAVFSTLAKSSLLYPIAECLGQLKWSYFEKRSSGTLNQLQHFDWASRGPWGAARLLWDVKWRAVLASLGAIVTILLLAFEPFAQQV
jgi:hypothetical protein